MKYGLITCLFVLMTMTCINAKAQVNPHAIGIRGLQGNYGSGGEISYQHAMGESNRLELDLGYGGRRHKGYNYSYFQFSALYHWVWNITDGLNWYAGLGGQLGHYKYVFCANCEGYGISAGGQIGIEYDFNTLGAPLLMSFDSRPMFVFNGAYSRYGAAFSLRYTF